MDLDRRARGRPEQPDDRAGEAGSYRIRLNEPPIADNWWLFIFADGEERSDGEYEGLSSSGGAEERALMTVRSAPLH